MTEPACKHISYRETGYFSRLMLDYLEEKTELKKLYNRFPSLDNFKAQIEEKQSFPKEKREVLSAVLSQQYANLEGARVLENIVALKSDKTFTITTGHQLNIFTGPLYFIYKILSTINLAEQLSEKYKEFRFVPVYWMATEDHDFAEINHINMEGGRLSWPRDASGATGRLSTEGLDEVITALKKLLPPSEAANEFISFLEVGYNESVNLAGATRYIVHQLFKDYGVVVIDADHQELKKFAITSFKNDLLKHTAKETTASANNYLDAHYAQQVFVRDINLFYLRDGLRERIELHNDRYHVINTSIEFSTEEILEELRNHPERFSPNVTLRPLYQEIVLPNLAYIGGGGELAYWLQYKDLFKKEKVPFPMLILRNSALLFTSKTKEKALKLGLEITDFFGGDLSAVKKKWVKKSSEMDIELSDYEKRLQQIFDELEDVANMTEKSMLGAVNAQRQKQLNGLDNLRKKLLRAEKRRHDDQMERLEELFFQLFPNGSLQERHNNISIWYARYGADLISKIKACFNPLDFRFTLIELEE